MALHGLAQQAAEHIQVIRDEVEIRLGQQALGGRPGEHGHQVMRALVLAHQHRRQLVADLHQVGQIGDVVLGDQVLDHADAFQPRTGAQNLGNLLRIDTGHRRDGRKRLLRGVDLELDQRAAQFALVTGQRAVEQDGALGRVELQQGAERGDVLLDQGRFTLELPIQPFAGGGQQRQHVLGRILGVFVEEEKQRVFGKRAVPDAVAGQKGLVAEAFIGRPTTRC